MTTPEDPQTAAAVATGDGASKERVKRPEPKRDGPNRAKTGAPDDAAAAPQPNEPADTSISGSVAQTVKTGYDVLTENIKLGREAAAKFREGEYNLREAPQTAQAMARQALRLMRQLSATTLEIAERLVEQFPASGTPPPGSPEAPAFRPVVTKAPSATAAKAAAPQPGAPVPTDLKLSVQFPGSTRGQSRTQSLARPSKPTSPGDISSTPLALRAGGASIADVKFEADLSVGGLTAVVTVPDGQTAGVYSGLVYAGDQDEPLGVLTIEITA